MGTEGDFAKESETIRFLNICPTISRRLRGKIVQMKTVDSDFLGPSRWYCGGCGKNHFEEEGKTR